MYAHTCYYLMMYFNLMKKNYFPIFHVHKNSNLNHFNSISKEANFRVLHNKITPRQGYLCVGLPVHFSELPLPTRAPSRGLGVDSCALGWQSHGLHHRPLLRPLLRDSPRLLLGDSLCLLRGDSHRLLLRDSLPSLRLLLYARVAQRRLSARWRSHWHFIVIRPLGHRRTPRPSGLVAAKRDAAWLAGDSTCCFPLLPG